LLALQALDTRVMQRSMVTADAEEVDPLLSSISENISEFTELMYEDHMSSVVENVKVLNEEVMCRTVVLRHILV
jgi:hypothetical protein